MRRSPLLSERLQFRLALGMFVAYLIYNIQLISHVASGDLSLYAAYANDFLHRHRFPVEYPPLSVAVFLLPRILPGDYQAHFVIMMSLLALLTALLLAREGYGPSMRFMFLAMFGTFATLTARYDLVAAVSVLGALLLAKRGRFRLSLLLLAAGVLLKAYPLFLFPAFVLEERRRKGGDWPWRGIALFAGVLMVGAAVETLLAPSAVGRLWWYTTARPIQVESVPATLLWILSWVQVPLHAVVDFGSLNLVSPASGVLSALSTAVLFGGLFFLYRRQWQGRLQLLDVSLTVLMLLLVTYRVLSPQYFIWLLPLLALSGASMSLWGPVFLATGLVYPYAYGLSPLMLHLPRHPLFMAIVALRNLLFVWAVVREVRKRLLAGTLRLGGDTRCESRNGDRSSWSGM